MTVHLQATYTYTIPYTATYLPDGPLSYSVKLWVNSEHDMVRLDTYDGLDSELHRDVCPSLPSQLHRHLECCCCALLIACIAPVSKKFTIAYPSCPQVGQAG